MILNDSGTQEESVRWASSEACEARPHKQVKEFRFDVKALPEACTEEKLDLRSNRDCLRVTEGAVATAPEQLQVFQEPWLTCGLSETLSEVEEALDELECADVRCKPIECWDGRCAQAAMDEGSLRCE